VTTDMGEEMAARARAYRETLAEHERARDALHEIALTAWRAGWRPATIAEQTGLHTGYLRKLARDAGLPAARTGRRTKAERSV
jgi:excisionase family DNA binding protein